MAGALPEIEGKYEILGKLQVGGMGAIYKVRHRLLGDERVVKVLRPQLIHDEAFQKRFHREARAATRLTHPNIARHYDFAVEKTGAAYIVMEYIEGWSLESLVKRSELTPLGLVLEIARQSLRAIGHLHGNGVIHRDISPDNLMLTQDVDGWPAIKLIDLGLAKSLTTAEEMITASGMFVGKFRYAAPELFRTEEGSPSAGPSSDLYSFSLVLYELLTGQFPIQGKSATSLMAGHLYHPPLPFDEADTEQRIPQDLRQVVMRALDKSANSRWPNADALANALEPIRARYEVETAETRRLLELLRHPPQVEPRPSPGSTQSRLDRQFGVSPGPADSKPADGASTDGASTDGTEDWLKRVEALIAESDYGAARQLWFQAIEASRAESTEPSPELEELGHRIDWMEKFERTRQVDAGLKAIKKLRAEGRPSEALEQAKELLEQAPDHQQVQSMVLELEEELVNQPANESTVNDRPIPVDEPPPAEVNPAMTEPFDEISLLKTEILPQLPVAARQDDLRTQVAQQAIDVGETSKPVVPQATWIEPQPTQPLSTDPVRPPAIEPPPIAPPPVAPPPVEPPPVEPPPVEPPPPPIEPPPVEPPPPPAVDLLDPLDSPSEQWGADLLDAPPAASPGPTTLARGFDEISLQTLPRQSPGSPLSAPELPPTAAELSPAAPELLLEPEIIRDAVLDDHTLTTGEGGEIVTWQGPPRGDLPSGQGNSRLFVTGVLLVISFLFIGVILARLSANRNMAAISSSEEQEPLQDQEVDSARLSKGEVVIEVKPWAEVVRIVNARGLPQPLPPVAKTPVTLVLDAGKYRVTLLHPPTNTVKDIEVQVTVAETRHVSHIIVP